MTKKKDLIKLAGSRPKETKPGVSPEQSGDAVDVQTKLRKRAEEQARTTEPISLSAQTPEEIQRLFHELRVHQIELEMQNEELRTAHEALEENRARYFDLYDLAPVGYCTLSEQGLILEANLTIATLLGIARNAPVKQPLSRFILKDDQDIYYLHRKKLIETGEPQECELRMVKPAGVLFWAHLTVTAVQTEDDTPVCRIVISDITDRKRTEEEKEKLQVQLQHAQKMEAIGTLAGGIAHDFNNILGAILGYAEMARDDCPSGSVISNDLDQVIKAGHRARDLVKQILAFSRQEEAQKFPLQAARIVKDTIQLLRSSIPVTIDIQQDIDPETDLILADPTQIHQIVMNLCTNAYHAMEETGGTLAITLGNKFLTQQNMTNTIHAQTGHFVQLSVRDSGSGIPLEIQEKIFDPYFTTKQTGKGTGMGLAIVHGIVKSNGGFITCHSEVGVGTVFKINLPSLSEQNLPEIKKVEMISVGIEHILFIDDEPMLVEVGKTMLERLGYTVTVQMNSFEALNTFKNQPDAFNLVITDQTMPGMTGLDLARRMLQIRPDLPIILCTGYSAIISEETARASGIKGFVLKPIAKKDIAAIIRKVLDEEN